MENVVNLNTGYEGNETPTEKVDLPEYQVIEYVPFEYRKEIALYCSIGLNIGFLFGLLIL